MNGQVVLLWVAFSRSGAIEQRIGFTILETVASDSCSSSV